MFLNFTLRSVLNNENNYAINTIFFFFFCPFFPASLLHSFGNSPVFNLGSGKSTVSKSTTSGTSTTSSSVRMSTANRSSHLSVTSSGSAHSKSKHRTKHSHSQSPTVMTSSINWDPTGILAAQVSRVSSTTTTTTTTTTTSAASISSSLSFLQGRKATTSTTTTKSTPVLHTQSQTGQRNNLETVSSCWLYSFICHSSYL